MKYLSEDISHSINRAVEQKFESVLSGILDNFLEFFISVTELREDFPDYDEELMVANVENAKKVCNEINSLIDKNYQRDDSVHFKSLFPDLSDALSQILLELEEEIQVEQPKDRFIVSATDRGLKRFKKRIKISLFNSHQLTLKIVRAFLPKSKKSKIKFRYWGQRIPLRRVSYYFLRDNLLKELSAIYEETLRNLAKKSISYWKYDERFDTEYIANFLRKNDSVKIKPASENPETIIKELQTLKSDIKTQIPASIKRCEDQLRFALERVDTIELSKSKFNKNQIEKYSKLIEDDFDKIIREWNNTLYALGEDWELNYDLHSARYSAIEVYFKIKKTLTIKNQIQIYPQFREISGSLNFIKEKLIQPATELQKIERVLAFLKENLQKVLLSSVIPNLINSIADLKFPKLIDESVSEIKSQINNITEKRAFVKTVTYDKKIKNSDIDEIHPREIISFSALPKLNHSFEEIKSKIVNKLKEIHSELINLGNSADFSLESALNAALVENLNQSEIKNIALQGIDVSLTKKENLLASYSNLINESLSSIRRLIAEYNDDMYSFTESSKIIEIRVQLAKEKTKARAKNVRESLSISFKKFIPVLFKRTKTYYRKGLRIYSDTRKQFGLEESGETIASEISDFLAKAGNNVEKLPYIYRRLFQLSPLENDRLFISRKQEEEQLELAHKKWLLGGYAPVIISAEKGGGITSFLNIFLKRLEGKSIITRVNIKPTISTQEELLKLFEKIFMNEKFLNIEELINYLNNENNRQIVIIENLQHMYLRNLKGFECLKLLTQIIPKTSKNIFWITSSTLYAKELLYKIIRFDDIFGYQIQLRQFDNRQITELIKKRNSISGYNLEFKPDPSVTRKRDFDKLSYKQKQILLEQDFFNRLNKFAQSNVTLALLFWLEAIIEILETNVYINADFDISGTILNSLSQEKVFVLHSLILHDGLRSNDLAKTINYSLDETNQLLQILYDDGVLIKKENVYLINPILYRQSINLLKIKNLI